MAGILLNEINYSGGAGVSELQDLTDANISNPLDGQVLKYDSSNNKWENANESGGASSLTELSDVNIALPQDGNVLKYNSNTSKWENAAESGGTTVVANPSGTASDDLTKIQIGSDIYDIPTGGGGASALADLSDVTITSSPVNKSFLRYNTGTGVWQDEVYEAKNEILSSLFNITNYRWYPFSFSNSTADEKQSLAFLGNKTVYLSFLRSYVSISDSSTKSTIIPVGPVVDLSDIYTTGPLAGLKLTIFITVEDGISYLNIKKSSPVNLGTYNVSAVFNLLYN